MGNLEWLSSKQVKDKYKIKSCDLMHLRLKGDLNFKKEGKAFFYSKSSVENTTKKKGG